MSEGKKIVFEGVDNVSKVTNTITSSFEKMNKESAKGTEANSRLIKEQNKDHEKLISLLEKERALIKDIVNLGHSPSQTKSSNQLVDRLFTNPENDFQRQTGNVLGAIHNNVDKNLNVGGLSSQIIQKLQELIETTKRTSDEHNETIKKTNEEIQSKYFDRTGNPVSEGLLKERNYQSVYDSDGKKVLNKYYNPNQKEKGEQEQSGNSNIIDLMRDSVAGGGSGLLSGIKEKVGDAGKSAGLSGGKLATLLLVTEALIKGIEKLKEQNLGEAREDVTDISDKERSLESTYRKNIVGRGLDLTGSLEAQLMRSKKHLGEVENIEAGKASFFGATGNQNFNPINAENLGYSIADTWSMGGDVAKTRGSSKNIREEVYAKQIANRFGSNISGLQGIEKFTNDKNSSSDYLGNLIKSGGTEELGSNLSELVSLMKRSVEGGSGIVSGKGAFDMIEAFSKIDGERFKHAETRSGIMNSISNSQSHPQNDFAKARLWSILAQKNPGADYNDMIEMMEDPNSVKGLFQSELDADKKQFGKKGSITALASRTGMTTKDARAIIEYIEANPGKFANMSTAEIGTSLEKVGINTEGLVDDKMKEIAKRKNAFSRSDNPDFRTAEEKRDAENAYSDSQKAAGRNGEALSDRVKSNYNDASILAKDAGTLTKEAADVWKKNGDDFSKIMESIKDTLPAIVPYMH